MGMGGHFDFVLVLVLDFMGFLLRWDLPHVYYSLFLLFAFCMHTFSMPSLLKAHNMPF